MAASRWVWTVVMEGTRVLQASTIDGRRKGACLFCQEYFMDLYLLAELKTISLKVSTPRQGLCRRFGFKDWPRKKAMIHTA